MGTFSKTPGEHYSQKPFDTWITPNTSKINQPYHVVMMWWGDDLIGTALTGITVTQREAELTADNRWWPLLTGNNRILTCQNAKSRWWSLQMSEITQKELEVFWSCISFVSPKTSVDLEWPSASYCCIPNLTEDMAFQSSEKKKKNRKWEVQTGNTYVVLLGAIETIEVWQRQ